MQDLWAHYRKIFACQEKAAVMGLYALLTLTKKLLQTHKCLQALLISEGCTHIIYSFIYFLKRSHLIGPTTNIFGKWGTPPTQKQKYASLPKIEVCFVMLPFYNPPILQATISYILQDQCSPPYFISLGLEFRDTSRVWTRNF